MEKFFKTLDKAYTEKRLYKLTLSKQRNKKSDLKKIIISLAEIKKGLVFHFVFRYETRDLTKNFSPEQAYEIINRQMRDNFYQADLYSDNENVKWQISSSGKNKWIRTPFDPPKQIDVKHNREKKRIFDPATDLFLKEMDIATSDGKVKKDMNSKYVQINKYIELLASELDFFTNREMLNITDMGSGKGYLSFALYHYISFRMGKQVTMKGVELRKELVDLCNNKSRQLGYGGLSFVENKIENVSLPEKSDILIALHACDTATDDAIGKGINSNTSLIVVAPCCQKQIRRNMHPQGALKSFLKYGILMEKQAEILTDALRTLYLEYAGYKTRVMEFTESEHTPKNLMITAKKDRAKAKWDRNKLEQIRDIKRIFNISHHHLEQYLDIPS